MTLRDEVAITGVIRSGNVSLSAGNTDLGPLKLPLFSSTLIRLFHAKHKSNIFPVHTHPEIDSTKTCIGKKYKFHNTLSFLKVITIYVPKMCTSSLLKSAKIYHPQFCNTRGALPHVQ